MRRLIIIVFAVVFLGATLFTNNSSAQAVAKCDTTFYSSNDILYYNPCETCANGSTTITGKNNEEKVFQWLSAKGFNAAQAAGMMANMNHESGLNPFRMQTTYSDSGIETVLPATDHSEYNKAFGLVQWDGGRRQQVLTQISAKFSDYVNLINTYGKSADGWQSAPPDTDSGFLAFELDFMYQELSNGYSSVLSDIKAQPNTEDGAAGAAVIWNEDYEVSADTSQDRPNKARDYYNQYKDAVTTASASSASSSSSSSDSSCGSTAGPSSSVVWYSQCDSAWTDTGYAGDTMCESGCGPTSMAIILATLVDKNIKPTDVAAVAGTQSGGTSSHGNLIDGVNAKWGLSISKTSVSFDEAVDFVKSGKGYIWMGGQGALPFTEGGHLVAMVGVTADGQITIADPYGDHTSSVGLHQRISNYPPEVISANAGSMYEVAKP